MLQISNISTTAIYFFIGLLNFYNLISAVKWLIGNIYIIYVCVLCIFIMYI